jgi:hypothetical protein
MKGEKPMEQKRRCQTPLVAGTVLLLILACTPTKKEQDIADTIVALVNTETPTPEYGYAPVDSDSAFGLFCGRVGLTDEQYAALFDSGISRDESGDLFDPWTGQASPDPPPASDIDYTLETTATFTTDQAEWLGGDVFPCDDESTFCEEERALTAGDYYILGAEMADAIPGTCPLAPCEYAVALAANEGNYQPAVELDLFGGTRWWYYLSDYGEGWHLTRIDSAADRYPASTNARVTVIDDEVVWLIPTNEITMTTGVRFATFTRAGADVNGSLPTDPLGPIPSVAITLGDGQSAYFPFALNQPLIVLPGDYNLLGPSCQPPADRDGMVWCNPTEACTLSLCECHLFSRADDDPPQDPDSWKHEAGQAGTGQVKVRKDEERDYHCYCVYQ